jgi:predicted metal-dependent peptidase
MEIKNFKAKQRFTEMRTAMLLHTPFFASLLLDVMDLRVGKYPGIDTAATNGKVIWIDEDFLAGLTLPEAVFMCCHEVGHAMWLHMDRFKRYQDLGFEGQKFYPGIANIAADYIINDMLVSAQIGTIGKGWLHSPKYKGNMQFEEVYKDIMKSIPPPPKGGGKGKPQDGKGKPQDGQGGSPGEGDDDDQQQGQPPEGAHGTPNKQGHGGLKPMDSHIYEPAQVAEAEMKRAIATAKNQAKAMGKMPAGLERWIDEVLKPQVNWKELLRTIITRTVSRDATTWTTPHRRRLVSQKVYLPSYTGHGAGEIVWATDTSGSMGQKEFDAAFAECADIIMTCRPERVWMMACDAKVHNVHELPSYHDIYGHKPAMHGGGGTAFEPVFDEVEKRGLDIAMLIYFTDGYGSFPKDPPPYPVIWVSTTDVVYPWGNSVRVELADYE